MRVADRGNRAATDYLRWAVGGFAVWRIVALGLDQHDLVDSDSKGQLNGCPINAATVSGQLHAIRNTSREPAHLTSSWAMVMKPELAEEIRENPCCSGNREGLCGFAPIRMIVGIRNKQRYPHEYPKDHEHHCQKASREKCHSIRK